MGYSVLQVSRELSLNRKLLEKEILKDDFSSLVYNQDGTMYINEDGMKKLLEFIDKGIIDISTTSMDSEFEIKLLKSELNFFKSECNLLKKELYEKDELLKSLKNKISEMQVMEERYCTIEKKIISNMKDNLTKRSEKNRKKRWF